VECAASLGEHHAKFDHGAVSGGVPELDELLGGGLQRGTSTLIIGAAGRASLRKSCRGSETRAEAIISLLSVMKMVRFARASSSVEVAPNAKHLCSLERT
tara:strand:- start:326 stop:625 length:300 start_codon:yes stop_codon:yes gene_type:complete